MNHFRYYITVITFLLLQMNLVADDEAYTLKPLDQIELSVYQEPDLSKNIRLNTNGEASFELIETLSLKGLTLQEASDLITKKLKDGYLNDPKVSLNLIKSAQEYVQVTGAVNSPGNVVIPTNSPLDLRAAISSAGGLSGSADPTEIILRRNTKITRHSMESLNENKTDLVYLQNGDQIEVYENIYAKAQVYIYGYVKTSGAIQFPKTGKLTLARLIELAGGTIPGADPSAAKIERNSSNFKSKGLTKTLLQPNDIVTIPANAFLNSTVTMSGQINRPGKLPFSPTGKMSLLDALSAANGPAKIGDQRKITVTRITNGETQVFKLNADKMEKGKAPLFFLKPNDTISIPKRFF